MPTPAHPTARAPIDALAPDWSFAFARHTAQGERAYQRCVARYFCVTTQRAGGESEGAFSSLNLSVAQGDDPGRVQRNRETLEGILPWPSVYLRLDHGCALFDADRWLDAQAPPKAGRMPNAGVPCGAAAPLNEAPPGIAEPRCAPISRTLRHLREEIVVPTADAAVLTLSGLSLVMLTADCLPVVIGDDAGRGLAIAHAGWRGLAVGVIETAALALRERLDDTQLIAWIGPGIGPAAFEVPSEVLAQFPVQERSAAYFRARDPKRFPGKWMGDLPALARKRCMDLGITRVGGGLWCTWHDTERFFSYRRQAISGRFATVIALRGLSETLR
jgi:YfiH family protein